MLVITLSNQAIAIRVGNVITLKKATEAGQPYALVAITGKVTKLPIIRHIAT